jgi:anti-sigma regulatory factor (Ser/Thr protein kinase)
LWHWRRLPVRTYVVRVTHTKVRRLHSIIFMECSPYIPLRWDPSRSTGTADKPEAHRALLVHGTATARPSHRGNQVPPPQEAFMLTVSPSECEGPPTWAYALQLPHDARAARIARVTLRAVLAGHGMAQLQDNAELLASELVTNAYRYSDGPAGLRLRGLGGDRLRVSVWDTNPHIPPPFDNRSRPLCPGPAEADGGVGCSLCATTRRPGAAIRSETTSSGGAGSCSGASWQSGPRTGWLRREPGRAPGGPGRPALSWETRHAL